MYRRDLLLAEIQQLSLALSRLMGLKEQDKKLELEAALEALLEKEFEIFYADFMASSRNELNVFFQEKNFPAEKLDILSQLLFLKIDPGSPSVVQQALMLRLLLIYDYLEDQHQVINILNIKRQQDIKKYLATQSPESF